MAEPVPVPLGHGLFALVDYRDAKRVLALTWHAWHKPGRPDVVYAQHTFRYGPGGRKAKTGTWWLHRFILDAPKGKLVDHKNGNGLDCTRDNMRLTDHRGNSQNVTLSKNQRAGRFKGVGGGDGRWTAQIRGGEVGDDGRRKRLGLGSFGTAEEAARAYDRAAIEAFGMFASLNFPEDARDEQDFAAALAESSERGRAVAASGFTPGAKGRVASAGIRQRSAKRRSVG